MKSPQTKLSTLPPNNHRSAAPLIADVKLNSNDRSSVPSYAKANLGKINYASVGSGAATNVAGELFTEMAGVNLVNVPYRSNYLPDLISGQVQASFTPILQSLGFIKSGKLRALAVTGATRSDLGPTSN